MAGIRQGASPRRFKLYQAKGKTVRRTSDRHVSRSPLTRLAQLVSICLVAFFCGPPTAQGCVFHADNGQPYKVTWRFLPQAGVVQGSRLKVVALGDSVVWGDGDKPEHRIVTLVSKSLANNSGRPVELDSYAHSGARLQYAPGEPATFPVRRGVPVGDVDASRPTTEEQLSGPIRRHYFRIARHSGKACQALILPCTQ
jgi:hypothetical protein